MAEGNVQLKLQATLDLEFLRAQVASLGKSLKTSSISVVATLDTKQLQKDVAKLGKEVRININDSQVEGARLRLAKLNQSLATFRKATATPLEIKVRYVQEGQAPAGLGTQKRGTFRQRLEAISPEEIKKLYRAAAQAGIVAFDQETSSRKKNIVTSLSKAGEDAVGGLLNGITSKKAALKTAAQSLGNDLIRALKASLDIASPSKRARDEIGKPIGDGIEQGVESSLKRAQTLNVADLRRYFNALKAEARQGSIQVAALIAANMAGLVRLPGGREQRARLQQSAAAVNAAMTGPALGNVQARRRTTQGQSQAAATTTPAFLSALPLMMGMKPQEWQQRMSGLYGQRYNAPGLQGFTRPNENRISSLINLLSSARGGLGAGGGALTGRISGLTSPSIIPTGYRNAAPYPSVVNYPPGMPPAYAAGFVGAPVGQFNMGRAPMADPGVVGIFATQLRQAIPAVKGFRFSLSRQLPALPAAGMTGLPGAQSRRVEQAYRRSEMRSASILAQDAISSVRRQASMIPSPWGEPSAPPRMYFRYGQGAQTPGYPLQQRLAPVGFNDRVVGSSGGAGGGGGGTGGGGGGRGGAIVPYAPRSELPSGYFAMGQLAANLRGADQYLRQARVPLAGAINELGLEFGEATKQVLLYGTAYKALAFFMDLPRQALDAATALQTFRNQLLAVTGSATNAEASFGFVDNLAARFAVPLQSVREGFVRLYASMSPAGFKAPEIEGLFSGISKAAATFGMSKEQVDRVTYAFSQMASKGQIMAEELRGQLGDVLPGSLALFAQAAQMSIPEFTKAMEDGRFKGEAMQAVLNNVGILLNTQFAAGAQGAAQTLRGALNTMQNEVQKLYEAFEPLVNQVAQQFFPLISAGIGDATAAVKAFAAATQGNQGPANMLSTSARNIYAAMVQVAEIGKALGSILIQVGTSLASFGQIALIVAQQLARLINTPVGGFLADLILKSTLMLAAFQALARTGIGLLISRLILLIAQTRAAGLGFAGLTAQMAASATMARVLRLALTGLFAGAILMGFEALVASISGVSKKLEETRNKAIEAKDAIRSMSTTEAIQAGRTASADIKALQAIAGRQDVETRRGFVAVTEQEKAALARAGISTIRQVTRGRGAAGIVDAVERSQLTAAVLSAEGRKSEAEYRVRQNKFEEQQQSVSLMPIPPGGGDAEKARTAAERAAEDARKLADEKRKYEGELMKLSSAQAIALSDAEFNHWKSLQTLKYDILEAGQNEWMAREIKFQRDLQAIEIRRIEAIRQARLEVVKAESEAQASAYVAGEVQVGTGGATGLLQGSTGVSSGPHFHVSRSDGGRISETEARALFDAGVRSQLQMTSGYGPRNTGIPGASTFHRGIDLAGPANTPLNLAPGYALQSAGMAGGLGYAANIRGPQGQMYQVGHLQQPRGGMPPSRQRTEAKQDYAAALDNQAAINAKELEQLATKQATAQAQQEINLLIREYVASIAPVEQQKLENALLEERIKLISSGLFGQALETQQKIVEVELRRKLGVETSTKAIRENQQAINLNNAAVKAGEKTKEQANEENATYSNNIAVNTKKIDELNKATKDYIPTLQTQLQLTEKQAFAEAMRDIGGRLAMARAMTPDEELRASLAAKGFTGASGESLFQQEKAVSEAEKLKASLQSIASSIGDAFGNAFKGIVTGSATAREALAGLFQSIADSFADMVAQIIADWIRVQAIEGLRKIFGIVSSVGGGLAGTLGSSASSIGFGGSFDAGIGGLTGIPDYSGAFTGFATGGIVTGPTLGLVGEGRYNEAIVPLPDGRSIPVDLGGGMGGSTNVVVNVDAKGTKVQGDEPNANQLGRVVSAAVQAELIKQKRPGGLLSA